jgi:uncharacterized Zn finger protein (UPF0148 family)
VFCVECAKEIPDGVKFCPDCGASQIVKVEEKTVKTKSNQWSTQKGIAMSKKKALAKKRKQDYSKCNVSELKEILKEKKLPVSGTKSELIERLMDSDWRPKTRKAKKNGVIYDAVKEIKEGYVFYGLLFLGFYFFVVYKIGYDDIRSQSPKRLGDGTYTPEKELTEFTMDELIYMFITAPGVFIGLTLGVLFLVIVLATVAETLEKLYKSQGRGKVSRGSAHIKDRGSAHIKGLGMLIGFLILIWGVVVADKQMEENDAVDDLNEAHKQLGDVEGLEYEEIEKEYAGYVFPVVGLAILLFYFTHRFD